MSRSETKSQLKQRVEELKRQLTDSQHRLREAESVQGDLEDAKDSLEAELSDTQRKLEESSQALLQALDELGAVRDRTRLEVTF